MNIYVGSYEIMNYYAEQLISDLHASSGFIDFRRWGL